MIYSLSGIDISNYKDEFNINISKSDLKRKLTDEKIEVVAVKGYYYAKGYKREEREKEEPEEKSNLD